MAKKKIPAWKQAGRGSIVSWGIYLAGVCALAALMVRGSMPESALRPGLTVLGALAVFLGGLAAGRGPLKPMAASLAVAAIVGLLPPLVGLGAWGGCSGPCLWMPLGCLAGGCGAGFVGSRPRRKSAARRQFL